MKQGSNRVSLGLGRYWPIYKGLRLSLSWGVRKRAGRESPGRAKIFLYQWQPKSCCQPREGSWSSLSLQKLESQQSIPASPGLLLPAGYVKLGEALG